METTVAVKIVIPSGLQKLMVDPLTDFTGEQIQDIMNFIEEYECNSECDVWDIAPYRCVFAYRDRYGNARAMYMTKNFTTGWAQLSEDISPTFGPADILEKLKNV